MATQSQTATQIRNGLLPIAGFLLEVLGNASKRHGSGYCGHDRPGTKAPLKGSGGCDGKAISGCFTLAKHEKSWFVMLRDWADEPIQHLQMARYAPAGNHKPLSIQVNPFVNWQV
jgi:hypothetical protein